MRQLPQGPHLTKNTLYAAVAAALGTTMTDSRKAGLDVLLAACEHANFGVRETAYVLATAWHETAHTLQPIKEYGGVEYKRRLYDVTGDNPPRAKSMGNTEPGDGVRYAGRGYVQLTWKVNYKKAGDLIGVNLVDEPDRAMEPAVAAEVIVLGMRDGWFTGKKLSRYITETTTDYTGARRIVNGTDQASKIAQYATAFESALKVEASAPVLRMGSRGPSVAILQSFLGLKQDFEFGPKTHLAVQAFQKSAGLLNDGVVGPATWAALKAGRQE